MSELIAFRHVRPSDPLRGSTGRTLADDIRAVASLARPENARRLCDIAVDVGRLEEALDLIVGDAAEDAAALAALALRSCHG